MKMQLVAYLFKQGAANAQLECRSYKPSTALIPLLGKSTAEVDALAGVVATQFMDDH